TSSSASDNTNINYSNYQVRTIAGHQFHTGPNDYPAASDLLYRNEGDGTFVDVSSTSGIGQLKAAGMGVLTADFDEDGDEDVFVANDQTANFLLINDGHGNFEEQGLLTGIAFDRNGRANGNMGVEYADLDGDQRLDLITTTYQEEMPVYYHSLGMGLFEDVTNIARLDVSLTAHVTWGIGAVDFDNDADRDLFIACGHFLDNIRFIDDRTDVKVADYLLANDGSGRFTNVTAIAGSYFEQVESSRGAAFDDLDNDGDVDVVVINFNAPPALGKTEAALENSSVFFKLVGTRSNRDALGSRVIVRNEAGTSQRLACFSGKGYESYYGRCLHVGLGSLTAAHPIRLKVQVNWPSGLVEAFPIELAPQAKRRSAVETLVEGTGVPLSKQRDGANSSP
ncbi:MAG: CRTAC1 family protein, partial [Aureliella sp.]